MFSFEMHKNAEFLELPTINGWDWKSKFTALEIKEEQNQIILVPKEKSHISENKNQEGWIWGVYAFSADKKSNFNDEYGRVS